MRKYFAYSSALDTQAFDEWKMQHGYSSFQLPRGTPSTAVDVRAVFDFPSKFWGGRVMGLEDAAGSSVEGVLFEIPEKDWLVICHKEGAMTGAAIEKTITVKVHGHSVDATAFITHPERRSLEGPVSPRFCETLERAYTSWKLSPKAMEQLRI